MKIKVISRGETEFEAESKHLAPAIREDAEAGKANGDWEVIRQMVSDCTEDERGFIDHRQYVTVTEDDGTPLWEGWLDGVDRPKPAEASGTADVKPPPSDVHVDWHMTSGEWRQLYTDLWQHTDTPYIARLIEAGRIPAPPVAQQQPLGDYLRERGRPGPADMVEAAERAVNTAAPEIAAAETETGPRADADAKVKDAARYAASLAGGYVTAGMIQRHCYVGYGRAVALLNAVAESGAIEPRDAKGRYAVPESSS